MIDGVVIKRLKLITDDRGWLMEILRDDDELFDQFGQVYVTACYPGIVKAWHAHEHQTDHLCCVQGMAKLGLWDGNLLSSGGQFQSIIIGVLNPVLVRVPPLVWHGFTPVGSEPVLMLNIPTRHYDYDEPDELRLDPFDPDVPFDWLTKGG